MLPITQSTDDTDRHQQIALQLAEQGWCAMADFIPPPLVGRLAIEADEAWKAGEFRPAGVGRGDELRVRPQIRNDRVRWLQPGCYSAAQLAYLEQLEQLRQAINRTLFLGLFDFEGHLAVYPPGSYYRRHLDQFRNVGQRTVTVILYLNNAWSDGDGGQLRIFTDPDDPRQHVEILPTGGTLVTFLSARFPHEVLPAVRDRLSLTGWFRVRGNSID
jgi:SM-20-related protein